MKLSKIYSNKADIFEPIDFVSGLNVVIAEIRLPENMNKDTHSLGKSTLGRLLNFCFLASRDPEFFLFKHKEKFNDFVFFLEIELNNGSFITIKRSVKEHSKISFKKHTVNREDFSELDKDSWDHSDIPIERAKDILDGILDLRTLKPWGYRNGFGYLVRSQDDFHNVFKLTHHKGADSSWKPFLANTLGFDATLITEFYDKEKELKDKQTKEIIIRSEVPKSDVDINGLLLLKRLEAEQKQSILSEFDFRGDDIEKTRALVDDIDFNIACLNERRYKLNKSKKRIEISLTEDKISFSTDDAERLFKDVGVYFAGQIKNDFKQLVEFNKAITEERNAYLKDELLEITKEIQSVSAELDELGIKRSNMLSFLSSTDVFDKYKRISDELIELRADVQALERQSSSLQRLQELRNNIRELNEEKDKLQSRIEHDVEVKNKDPNSLFSKIRINFSDIVSKVIDHKALLSVAVNSQGHLTFSADILDESGSTSSAGMGHTYKKLLCVAFDMAVLRAYEHTKHPKFLYHDGIFESLDDRKKENLLNVIREYSSSGLQHVITLIDSDLPIQNGQDKIFSDQEIVLKLHDDGLSGRLFKMEQW